RRAAPSCARPAATADARARRECAAATAAAAGRERSRVLRAATAAPPALTGVVGALLPARSVRERGAGPGFAGCPATAESAQPVPAAAAPPGSCGAHLRLRGPARARRGA